MWKNWVLTGRPLQIFFCKSCYGSAPQDDSFYVSQDRTLKTCQGIHPLPQEDYEAVIKLINEHDIIDKAISACVAIYGTCVYK